ncbi:hypothetical protein DRE_02725 [Drechslerella stenobrocha 248]|uniref:Uncharacterized protein n=1 Tax=Drechslerella stenobrocha 248 TaxID=1043628 RepID=W7I6K1_9PEZI|nr:hypothetical protein DRE_02725 [Drechslerella stenobrocha 248]
MAGDKFKASASASAILQSHVGVVLATIAGVALLIIVFSASLCLYFKTCRGRKQGRLAQAVGCGQRKLGAVPLIAPLAGIKTQDPLDNAGEAILPRSPEALHKRGCGPTWLDSRNMDYIESGASGPGAGLIPDSASSASRSVRNLSPVPTPPRTPDPHTLLAISHWSQPSQIPDTLSLRIDRKRPSDTRPNSSRLSARSLNRVRGRSVLPASSAFERRCQHMQAGQDLVQQLRLAQRKDRSKTGLNARVASRRAGNRLRKFGDFEPGTGARGTWEGESQNQIDNGLELEDSLSLETALSYDTLHGSDGPGAEDGAVLGPEQTYRTSIISAYRQDLGSEEQDLEMYLWKPLPKPPAENVWAPTSVELI